MIGSWWSRLTKKKAAKSEALNDAVFDEKILKGQLAKDLREALRAHAKSPGFAADQLPKLVDRLHRASWSQREIDKVLAYADYFSGANARGYERVIQGALARDDYAMFMTSYWACLWADRFDECTILLDTFQPDEDPSTDWADYLPTAGYAHTLTDRPLAGALAYYDKALERGLFTADLAANAYVSYFEMSRFEQCLMVRELVLQHCPKNPEVLYAMSCVELARGYYGEGFRLMEARYGFPLLERTLKTSLLQKPRWKEQPLAGKRLLVHGEQGLGDLIMMARYLPLLHQAGAELLVDGRPEACSLLTHNFPYCQYLPGDVQTPITEAFDYWTGIMSLPFQFNTTTYTVPATQGYLKVPDEHAVYWRNRVRSLANGATVRIGIAWSGNPAHRADRRRSIPFELFAPLIRNNPDLRFFSLQTHAPTAGMANMVNISEELITMADTAAAISEMDLVISVDTSAIHLAGALGKPAWLLLPYRYEWRWGLDGPSNAWYSSVKVWRQMSQGAWAPLLQDIGEALQRHKPPSAGVGP